MQNQAEDPIQEYLLSRWNSITNTNAKQTVVNQAEAKLGQLKQQIEEDQLQIAETTVEYEVMQKNIEKKPPPPPPEMSMEDRLKEILHKKEEMMERLNLMALEQSKLKENTRHREGPAPKPKSQITPEQVQLIKSLNASYRNFERQLQRKTKEYEQKQRQFRQEEQELEESHKAEASKAKRQQIMAKLEAMRKRQQEREQKRAEDEKALAELRNKRNLYQQWQDKFIEQQMQQQKRIEQMQEQARKLKETDFDAIKEHKRKYEEMMNKQKQERANKIAEFRREFEQRSQKYPESRFYSVIKEEQMKKEQQNQQKSLLPKLNLDKRLKYAEKVKQQILPNMRARKTDHEIDAEDKRQQIRSMSVNQLISKGNEYMHQARNFIRKHPQGPLLKLDHPLPTQQPFKHKNYLNELKMNRTGHEKSQLDKVRAIMESDHVDPDRLFKAKMLANKMQKNAGNSSKKLMESIQAKIEILNKLS